MADLTVYINEKITLDGNDRGVLTTQTISNINNIDNRILNIPTGSYTPLFYFNPSNIDAGTFPTGSFKYGRITNKSSTVPIQVRITADTTPTSTLTNTSFIITPGNSFFLSTTAITGSTPGSNTFTFNQYVYYISVAPSSSSASIEYFIATT
ncbi:hypothetical protein MEO93_27040 [Dolichospermum sp. ST_sed3]|nr:hypothetical protein [Dolichospermum sp. ST_sed3]